MPFDPKEQRRILGKFATGVTIASTTFEERHWGLTANAITSVSLDPPLVLLCIQRNGQSLDRFKAAGCFALSILSADQRDLSDRFAFKGPKDFSGLDVKTAVTGAPILTNALGWVDCRLTEVVPGGDHDILIGEIVAGDAMDGQPLLYFSGKYGQLA